MTLRFNGGGRTKSRIIKNVEVFAHGTWRTFGGYGAAIPIFFGRGVLLIGVGFNQTGVCRKALAAHQAFGDAPCHSRLEQVT